MQGLFFIFFSFPKDFGILVRHDSPALKSSHIFLMSKGLPLLYVNVTWMKMLIAGSDLFRCCLWVWRNWYYPLALVIPFRITHSTLYCLKWKVFSLSLDRSAFSFPVSVTRGGILHGSDETSFVSRVRGLVKSFPAMPFCF